MPFVPDAPRRGESVLPWARQITDYLRFVYPRGGSSHAGSGGASFLATLARRGGGSNPIPQTFLPFQLVAWSDESGNPKLRIVGSTIVGAASGLPSGFNQGPDGTSWLGAPHSGQRYVYIKVLTSGGSYSSSSIIDSADDNLDPGSSENAVALLGSYDYQAGPTGHFTVAPNFGYGPATLSICPRAYTSPREYDAWLTLSGYGGA